MAGWVLSFGNGAVGIQMLSGEDKEENRCIWIYVKQMWTYMDIN